MINIGERKDYDNIENVLFNRVKDNTQTTFGIYAKKLLSKLG